MSSPMITLTHHPDPYIQERHRQVYELKVQMHSDPHFEQKTHNLTEFKNNVVNFIHNRDSQYAHTVDPNTFIQTLGSTPSQDVLNQALFLLIQLMPDPIHHPNLYANLVKALLEKGADPNTHESQLLCEDALKRPFMDKKLPESLLMTAIELGNVDVARLLIGHGAHLDPQADKGEWRGLGSHYIEVAKELNRKELNQALCKMHNPYDELLHQTGIHLRERDDVQGLELWLDMGARISAVNYPAYRRSRPWSMLMAFIRHQNVPVVHLLIARGAHFDPTADGTDWLDGASGSHFRKVARELSHDELRKVFCKIHNPYDALLLETCKSWPVSQVSDVQLWLDMGTTFEAMQAAREILIEIEYEAQSALHMSPTQRFGTVFHRDPQKALDIVQAQLQAVEDRMHPMNTAVAMGLHPRLSENSLLQSLSPELARQIMHQHFGPGHPH